MATKKPSASKRPVGRPRKTPQAPRAKAQGEHIFALDIGTRTIVGVVGIMRDDDFKILDYEVVAHPKRAMVDGQIEDIEQVAKIVGIVKSTLEKRLKMKLTGVSIAAAGRALRTQHITLEHDAQGRDIITEDFVKSIEVETIQKAQQELDAQSDDPTMQFYCVGHSVVSFKLDDYPISTLIGHKGKTIKVELIAAFLPGPVVESLYAVMDLNKLKVTSLTLEPIAAMNVIIPKEIRLINIALIDIGAGTSDIAISQDGSIVAYAMATVAGDEITEEIMRKFLVSFDAAEQMKQCLDDEISYKDILGFSRTVSRQELFDSVSTQIEALSQTICQSVYDVNKGAPAAVFLVGGGSRVPKLCELVAQNLDIDASRVAVGDKGFIKNIELPSTEMAGPEFVTPIGIAVTATMGQSYDFSTISINGESIRAFNSRSLTVLEALSLSNYKPTQLMGRTGRSLTFTVNGERRVVKGGHYTAAEILVNKKPASISSLVTQGDEINISPAVNGENAHAKISDILKGANSGAILIAGNSYPFGPKAKVSGEEVDLDYEIQNFDEIEIEPISTLGDIVRPLALPIADYELAVDGHIVGLDYILHDGDVITLSPKEKETPTPQRSGDMVTSASQLAQPQTPIPTDDPELIKTISVTLNGKRINLEPKEDYTPYLFFDLLVYTDIDPQNPQGSGNLILTINDKPASYTERLHNGDTVVIGWK